jgi:creatine kinase
MGAASSTSAWELRAKYAEHDEFGRDIRRILAIGELYPDNLAVKAMNQLLEYFDGLSDDDKRALLKCARSGIENPDSGVGCYAMHPTDYDKFKPFFSKVLSWYHKVPEDAKHESNWSLDGVEGLPEDGQLDLAKLGLGELSMRVRVGRNLADFPLPGAMTQDDRVNLEAKMCEAFKVLMADPKFGGRYYSLTPGHESHVSEEQYNSLVSQHVMFKDMAADSYLATAGISGDWPYGRGCYCSGASLLEGDDSAAPTEGEDATRYKVIVWCNEEDHLRIMVMGKGTVLNEVFDRLRKVLDTVSGLEGLTFAHSEQYGCVTSCPSNLGTGCRASVHIQLPNLTKDGTDKQAKAIARPLGLSVRGTGGEHTPIGADGTVDISPSARFCISEAQIITALYKGIKLLLEEEQKAA